MLGLSLQPPLTWAGAWLRDLWGRGQRLDADRLLDQVTGRRLDFGRLAAELS
jgi:hypothetical protein